MSRFLQEALVEEKPKAHEVSLENVMDDSDLEITVAECQELVHSMESDCEEVERASAIAYGLECLAMNSERIESASVTDLAYVDVGMGLALAGTNISAEEALPGLENCVETTISTEAMRRIAGNVWVTIKNAIKKFINAMVTFWKKYMGAIPSIIAKAEKLKEAATEAMDKTASDTTIKLSREVHALSMSLKAPKGGADVVKVVTTLGRIVEPLFGKGLDPIVALPGKIKSDLSGIAFTDIAEVEASITKVTEAVTGAFVKSELNKVIKAKIKDERFDEQRADSKQFVLPGAKALVFSTPKPGTGVFAKLDAASRTSLTVMDQYTRKVDALESADMSVMTPEQIVEVADSIIAVLTSVHEYETGKASNTIVSESDVLSKVTGKLEDAYKASSKEEGFSEAQMAPFRNGVRSLNMAYLKWANSATTSVAAIALSTSRAAITACNRSLKVYKA